MSKKRKGRDANQNQTMIEGTDSRIPACEQAGNAVLDAYDKKESATEKIRKAEDAMMVTMEQHHITEYKVNGQRFKIDNKKKLTVKKVPIGKTANA